MTATQMLNLLSSATIPLPALEVVALLVLLSACLLFRTTRIGLLAAYIVVYRWGFLFFMNNAQSSLVAYMIFGGFVAVLTVIGMLHKPDAD